MKTRDYLAILFTVILSSVSTNAQDFLGLDPEGLKTEKDFKNAEERVLECANYLLSNPIDKDILTRKAIFPFLFKWMDGTPEHTFSLEAEIVELTGNDNRLITIYFASVAKVSLENSTVQYTDEEIQDQATQYLINYCSNPENHLKATKKMKKIGKKNKT